MNLFDEIPYLENEYVILKKMSPEDAPVLEEMSSNEHVTRYLPTFLFELQYEDKKQAIAEMYGELFETRQSLLLGIYPKLDDRSAGNALEADSEGQSINHDINNNAADCSEMSLETSCESQRIDYSTNGITTSYSANAPAADNESTEEYACTEKNSIAVLKGSSSNNQIGRLAGIFEFYNYDPNWNKVSIGIRLNESAWHKKYAEHAMSLAVDYLIEQTDIRRITAHVMTQNIYSARTAMRLGFRKRRSSVAEDWGFSEPVLVDKFVYEKWGNIKYVKIGSGPKVMVILPGLALKSTLGAADSISKNFAEFSDYTIYLFDDRDSIEKGYTIRERAGDVAAEMKTLRLKNACVYGASLGGMVGQYLAIDHPDLVEKLFIVSSCAKLDNQAIEVVCQWRQLAAEANEPAESENSSALETLVKNIIEHIYSPSIVQRYGHDLIGGVGNVSADDLDKFIILIDAILNFNSYDELVKIKCPVMAVNAIGDRILSNESFHIMCNKLGCRHITYGAEFGHGVYDEAPDMHAKMLEFFS